MELGSLKTVFVSFTEVLSNVAGVSGSNSNPDSTFTPVPATITPAGLELDPDTPATLEEISKTDNSEIKNY